MSHMTVEAAVSTPLYARFSRRFRGIVIDWAIAMAVSATLVLLLRARTYANGSQAIALLATGMLSAAGIMIGWLIGADTFDRLLWVFGTLVLIAGASLVLGVIFAEQRFSPPLRRTVEIIEAICIAVLLPLALAVMNLYGTLRHVNILPAN